MILLFALACVAPAPSDEPSVDDTVDLRLSDADVPLEAGATQELWWGPEAVIQPGEDKMFCIFGTYTGDDAGVHALDTFQNGYGHHLLLMGTTASALDFPDGTVADCSAEGDLSMADLEPLVLPTGGSVGGEWAEIGVALADGMAVKLDAGQRWVLQGHTINTTGEPLRVRDVARLTLLEEDAVETWAAPFVLNADDFTIPPGEAHTLTFDCPVETDLTALYLTGHLHEWGTSFRAEHVGVGTLYDIPEWDPSWRDAPPVERFDGAGYPLAAGDTLRTTCSWFNDTDEPLAFPTEMCASVMVVYPQLTAIICDGG
jgi:hypothetical protein